MRCESHFKSGSFGNVKAFNLKKIKIIAEPVAAMAAGGPAAGGRPGSLGKSRFLRQTKGRTVFGLESFESIRETSRSYVEISTWAI